MRPACFLRLLLCSAALLLAVGAFTPALAKKDCLAPEKLDPEIERLFAQGIDNIQNLEVDKADTAFDTILKNFPGQPYGYLGRALTAYSRLIYQEEQSDPGLERLFHERMQEAIDKGEEWILQHPCDPNAHLCVGSMYGVRAVLYIHGHHWIKAYFSGKKALKIINRAIEIDPEFYDAYIGPGLYEYEAGSLTGVVKLLSKLIGKADVQSGLDKLRLVVEKGRYLNTMAKLLLIDAYTQHDRPFTNGPQALVYARQLREKYPAQPLIHFVEATALYVSGDYENTKKSGEEFMRKVEEGAPYYRKSYYGRGCITAGTAAFVLHQYALAEEWFRKGAANVDPAHPDRWGVWCYVRLGNLYDLLGQRKEALEAYNKALSMKDLWGFADFVREYTKKPFTEKDFPGQLAPY
ncbi:MAG: hypothetical protein GX410_05010 [Elusimicrobia bacterium]|nr:hypothetical protein [Elusimicrobiota bacterium]